MSNLQFITIFKWFGFRGITPFVILSSGCASIFVNHDYDYLKNESTPPLTMPAEMREPANRNPVVFPYVDADYKPPENIIVPPPLQVRDEAIVAKVKSNISTDAIDDEENKGYEEALSTVATKIAKKTGVIKSNLVTDSENITALIADVGFDIVWPRIGTAVTALGFVVKDKDKLDGIYTIEKEILTFDFEERDYSKPEELELEKSPDKEEYKLVLNEESFKTRITVHDKEGEILGSSVSNLLLVQIQGQLENSPDKAKQ